MRCVSSEETPNSKSGARVSARTSCDTNSELKPNDATKQSMAVTVPLVNNVQAGTKPRKRASQTSATKETSKKNCLTLQQRVQTINYAKDHPNEGYRKVADKFSIGRTQAQKILKERKAILAQYESNKQSSKLKRVRLAKYSNVNPALWEWYTL